MNEKTAQYLTISHNSGISTADPGSCRCYGHHQRRLWSTRSQQQVETMGSPSRSRPKRAKKIINWKGTVEGGANAVQFLDDAKRRQTSNWKFGGRLASGEVSCWSSTTDPKWFLRPLFICVSSQHRRVSLVFNFNHEPFSGRPVSKLRPPTLLLDGRFFWLRFPFAFDCVSPRAASAPRLSPILHLSSKEEDHSQNRKGRKSAKKRLKGGEKKKSFKSILELA